MTVALRKFAAGLARCNFAYDARTNCWSASPGRTFHLAIVDQGKGTATTLLYEGYNTDNPDTQAIATEFTTWLGTVHF